ncbi:MAG TPA: hypothetical protein VHF89_14585 [Solirubrobacteraceae bacterium]|nr:hypothetical protein [Solirubrobacteraceae bacterium]
MRRWRLLLLIVPLCAPASAAAREGRCPDRPGYRVVERSGDFVVTARSVRFGEVVYRACLRSAGRDPVVGVDSWGDSAESEGVERFVFGGRFVAAFGLFADRYGDHTRYVTVADLGSGRFAARNVGAPPGPTAHVPLGEAVVSRHGHVAWVDGGDTIRAIVAGRAIAVAYVAGARLARLWFDGDVLHWTQDDQAREHRLPDAGTRRVTTEGRCRRPAGFRWALVRPSGFAFSRVRRSRVTWRACLRSAPRPVALGETRYDGVRGGTVAEPLLAGGFAALVVREHSPRSGAGDAAVTIHDLARRRRLVTLAALGEPGEDVVAGEAALGPAGHLAVVVHAGGRARLVVVGTGRRSALADGLHIGALAVERSSVRWVQDGVGRSAALPPAAAL